MATASSIEPHLVPYPTPPADAPNMVVIVLDDIGFGQLGCFGSLINTPHIDSLAERGIRLNRFHVTSICSSTRAALFTGRNHHAVGVGATQETSFALPGYNGRIPKTAAALPRILRDNGYNTMCVGKWHLTPQADYSASGPFERWPLGMGFERYYGFLGAETNHWSPELVRDNTPIPTPTHTTQGGAYHLTEDLTDQAISMIRDQQHATTDKPFFLWFATGAAHAPHHVTREWFEPYAGQFDEGWEVLRERTYRRQLALGVIPPDTNLTPRPTWVPEWSTLSADERRLFARYMEVFAGFVTHTDAQIGRILAFLDEQGLADNTIITLMSDNGTSSEGGPTGTLNEAASWLGDHATVEEALANIDEIGGPNHTNHYPWGWAWAGNSPFQLWKRYSWLGGVRAPFIARWPKKITDAGSVRNQFTHAIDLAPTLLGAIGLSMPEVVDGVQQQRVDGVDASNMLFDVARPEHRHTQYFEMHGSRSIYHEGWKATSNFVSPLFNERAHITGSHSFETDVWQLFDLTNDFSESIDLSAQYPERVRELESLWIEQATANNVFPLFDPAAGYPAHPGEYPLPRSATYQPSDHPIAAGRVPSMFGGFTMSAIVNCPATENGIIAALGDHQGGWTLRLDHGTPHFDVVYGHQRAHLVGTNKISAGTHQLTVTMKAGALALFVNDEQVANGHFGGLFMFPGVTTAAGGMWIGRHEGLPIVDSYSCPNNFTGNITSVTVSSGSPSSGPSLATTMRIAEGAD
jgi:arylsulfatase